MTITKNIEQLIHQDELNIHLRKLSLQNHNIAFYLVGGTVRDLYCTHSLPGDRDYVVIGEKATIVGKWIAETLGGTYVLLDAENDIVRVVLQDKVRYLDIAACVGNNIEEDLARRDFTVNALAFNIDNTNSKHLFDPYQGQQDIQNKLIRAISEQNIKDDPLRILRAYRLSCQLGFPIDQTTVEIIRNNLPLIHNVAPERISQEIIKLIHFNQSHPTLYQMYLDGLLETLIPKLSEQRAIPPNAYHHLYLIEHTLEVYKQVEIWYKEFPDWAQKSLDQEISQGINKLGCTKLGAIFHDIAKPDTWNGGEGGKHSFIGHDKIGEEITHKILEKLRFGKNLRKIVAKLVRYHLRPYQLTGDSQYPTKKAVYKMFRNVEDDVIPLLLLAIADKNSAKGGLKTDKDFEFKDQLIFWLLDAYQEYCEAMPHIPDIINGKDIMDFFNLPAGPEIGTLKSLVEEELALGTIKTKEEALSWLKQTRDSTSS